MPYGDALDALSAGPPPPHGQPRHDPRGPRAPRDRAARRGGRPARQLPRRLRAAPAASSPRRYGAPRAPSLEGFLFPATYELEPDATADDLVAKQLDAFQREHRARSTCAARSARNLTTYDVLIIASMVEREAPLAKERPLVAAVIHNRLREGMPLGIDATIRYATRNWTRPLKQSELDDRLAVQHAPAHRPAADADRQPGPGLDQGRREPGQGQLPVLRRQAQRRRRAQLLLDRRGVPARRRRLQRAREAAAAARTRRRTAAERRRGASKRFGVLGWPVAHSRSPAMHRGRLRGARPRRTGATSACRSRPSCSPRRCARCRRPGFAGANVTIPHKEAALALADDGDRRRARDRRREHAHLRRRRHDPRRQHRRAGPASPRSATVPPSARSSSARAARPARRSGRSARRASTSPCTNRTRERAEGLGARGRRRAESARTCSSTARASGSTTPDALAGRSRWLRRRRRPRLPRRRHRARPPRARAAGARIVDGLEILVRQGALSFELWTGRPAPLEAMRRAVRQDAR